MKNATTRRRVRPFTLVATLFAGLALAFATMTSASANVPSDGGTFHLDSSSASFSTFDTANAIGDGGYPSGTTLVAVLVCDVSDPMTIGTECDADSATNNLTSTATFASPGVAVTFDQTFTPTDFTVQPPHTGTGTVECKTSSTDTTTGHDQCAVVVSFYSATTQLGADYVPVYIS